MSERRVALTFDAEHPSRGGSSPDAIREILDVLRRQDVRATFFVQGRWATAHPAAAAEIARRGHLVGSHSHYHAPMPLFSPQGLAEDVGRAQRAIRETTGADPRPWFRPPFGAGTDNPNVRDGLSELGYRAIGWDVDGRDWEEGRTPHEIADDIIHGVRSREGTSIVVLHTWPGSTPRALGRILSGLRQDDAVFVTPAEVLGGS